MGPRLRDRHLGGLAPGHEGRDRILLVRQGGSYRKEKTALLSRIKSYTWWKSPQESYGGTQIIWVVAVHAVPLP
eukprot:2028934-Pyramimonas_sp.AAC.1